MKSFISVLIFLVASDNVSSHRDYLHGIHYPIEHEHSRDCQLEYSGLRGECKRFSECQSAQHGWLSGKVYPTLCYYHKFEAIVCCMDHHKVPPYRHPFINNGGNKDPGCNKPHNGQPHHSISPTDMKESNIKNQYSTNNGSNRITSPSTTFNKFPISNGNNQGNFPSTNNQFPNIGNGQQSRPDTNNQFPNIGNGQENRPNSNNQFPINSGNDQGIFPSTNNQFLNIGNGQQNRPHSNNKFPINSGNDQGILPSTNNQLPNIGNGQQNRPNSNNQFPIDSGNDQGTFASTNNQFQNIGNGQQNAPNSNNQFPINSGNDQGTFPSTNNQFPNIGNGQQNRPNSNIQFPTSGNNQGNFPNTNNQFPVAANQISQTNFSDCTVVIIQDPNNPIDSPCVVPDSNQNTQGQTQFGQINTQNGQQSFGNTMQQNQQETSIQTQVSDMPEEEEFTPQRMSQDRCGDHYDVTPLVGGEPTEIGEYPFMVAIGWKRFDDQLEFNCGGFLVSQQFVLTAAHCASLGGDKPFAVRTGGINLDNVTSSDLDIPIQEIIVHPGYQEDRTYNDIALLKLSRKSNDVYACLWQKNDIDKEYEEVKAIGYGHISFGGPRSNSLLQIKLKLFENRECSPFYKPESRFPNGIIDSQICSGDLTRAKDTCQGDSGGPIFVERDSIVGKLTPIVIGITSFGQGCAGEAPSIYTRISSFLDWIEPIVWKEFYDYDL